MKEGRDEEQRGEERTGYEEGQLQLQRVRHGQAGSPPETAFMLLLLLPRYRVGRWLEKQLCCRRSSGLDVGARLVKTGEKETLPSA